MLRTVPGRCERQDWLVLQPDINGARKNGSGF
jgi:hypothetical protein